MRRREDFARPTAPSDQELGALHAPAYLKSLREPASLVRILEVPIVARLPSWVIDWRVLRPMRLATGGTLLACRLALERGVAINLGGGFHHAAADWGGGFCVYADVPWAAAVLYREGKIGKVLVVDLDAHQGNGTAAVFRALPWASIFDVYQEDLFPRRKEPEDYPFPVPRGTTGGEYLELIREFLPMALDRVRPDLVIYNAGSDPYVDDPLAGLCLTMTDLADRDLMVATLAPTGRFRWRWCSQAAIPLCRGKFTSMRSRHSSRALTRGHGSLNPTFIIANLAVCTSPIAGMQRRIMSDWRAVSDCSIRISSGAMSLGECWVLPPPITY